MEKYDENYKADWIITVTSSEANGTAVYNLYGSIDDVKQTLVRLQHQIVKTMNTVTNMAVNLLMMSLTRAMDAAGFFLLIVHMTIIILTIKQSERIIFNQ